MSARRKGRGKGPKVKSSQSEALGSSTSVQNIISEQGVDTPQDPEHNTNVTVMDQNETVNMQRTEKSGVGDVDSDVSSRSAVV